MTDEKTTRERLEKVLEDSDLYYVQTGDSWVTRRDDAEVKFTQVGSLVRASVTTGVIADDENRAAIRAMADHLEGWEYKIACFDIPADGEVTIFYDRQIGSCEGPDGAPPRPYCKGGQREASSRRGGRVAPPRVQGRQP